MCDVGKTDKERWNNGYATLDFGPFRGGVFQLNHVRCGILLQQERCAFCVGRKKKKKQSNKTVVMQGDRQG
jgi:hypothetical protein